MAAKLRQKDGSYYVVVHHGGRRRWKKIGRDKREALKVVHKVNAQLALGDFSMGRDRDVPNVAEALHSWYEDYKPTFSASYAQLIEINVRRHLVPAFGNLRLSEISERHILQFISEKTPGKVDFDATWSCRSRDDAQGLRPCASRGRNRSELPRLPRHQTAPPRH